MTLRRKGTKEVRTMRRKIVIPFGILLVVGMAFASQFHWDDKLVNDQLSRSGGTAWMECVHSDLVHFVIYADADRTGDFSRGDTIVGVLDYRKTNSKPVDPVASVKPEGGVHFGLR
jgi:hypothetical protein